MTRFSLTHAASDQAVGSAFRQLLSLCHLSKTMNELKVESSNPLLGYQTQRLQDLIKEILQYCKGQASYLSSKFGIPEAELSCLMLFGGERYLTAKGISQRLDEAKAYAVTALPSVEVNGEMLECCKRGPITKKDLHTAGIGRPL